MATTDTGLADIRAKINLMKGQVADSYAALAELNVLPVGSAKLENLPQTIERLAVGTTVSCILNPTGSDYQLPTSQAERSALLTGAKVKVRNEDGEVIAEAAIPGLVNSTFYVQVPGIVAKTPITVAVIFGNNTYTCAAISTYLEPNRVTSCAFASKNSTGEIEEIGRFQLFDDNTGTSHLIRRVTDASGVKTLHYGGFYIDGTGTAVWQNHSGIYTTVKSCADASSEVVTTNVNACSDAGARNLEECLNVFSNMRPVTATSTDATGVTVVNKMMQYPKFYCKTEKTTLEIVTYNEDGTIASTQTKDVVIKWMSNVKADSAYHVHAAFIRSVRTGDNTFEDTELDHFFYSRYPMNWTTVHHTASATSMVAQCTNDGICPTSAVLRDNANAYARNLNRLACVITDDTSGETIAELAANEDSRAFAASSSHDIAFFQWICVLMYGVEIQTVIMGNCTDSESNPQTKNGDTDWLFEKGIRFGSANNSSNTQPCLVAGIEDGIHSSQGTFMNDLTYFAERTIDGDEESKRAFMLYARDRLDWTPQVSTVETLKANGYRELSFDLNSNTTASNTTISNVRKRLGYDEGVGARDLMIMCGPQDEPNFQIAAIDNFWFGATPAVGTAGTSAYLVAFGGGRRNGRSLGLFTINADAALSVASAGGWRPRLSLQVVGV